jgi:hypothetical protein
MHRTIIAEQPNLFHEALNPVINDLQCRPRFTLVAPLRFLGDEVATKTAAWQTQLDVAIAAIN